jgi:AmmeMemoRadiSam system protein A
MPVLDAPRSPASDRRLPPPVELSAVAQAHLLDVARWALAAAVQGSPDLALEAAEAPGGPPEEELHAAAFVTLREGGELRGCIGTLDEDAPVSRSVALAAIGSALRDWRFTPVTDFELPALEVEVSVLGPLVRLEDPLAFRLGVDGLYVTNGVARGLLLPDVATTHGLTRQGMLEATCRKAGLPPEAWRTPGVTVAAFRTLRIAGPALERPTAASASRT